MVIVVFCPFCKQKVTAETVYKDYGVISAISQQHHVEVMHTVGLGDLLGEAHHWKLRAEEKKQLGAALEQKSQKESAKHEKRKKQLRRSI